MASFFALLPYSIGTLVIVEVIFYWPGLAYFAFRQGLEGDYYVLFIVLLWTAPLVLDGGLLTEITYALVDPRLQREESAKTIALKNNHRLSLVIGAALLFSLLYYLLQSFLEEFPITILSAFWGLLLIGRFLWLAVRKGGLIEKSRRSFSFSDSFSTLRLVYSSYFF